MIDQPDGPKTISVTEFKAHCTEKRRAVEEKGTRLIITRHGNFITRKRPMVVLSKLPLQDLNIVEEQIVIFP